MDADLERSVRETLVKLGETWGVDFAGDEPLEFLLNECVFLAEEDRNARWHYKNLYYDLVQKVGHI